MAIEFKDAEGRPSTLMASVPKRGLVLSGYRKATPDDLARAYDAMPDEQVKAMWRAFLEQTGRGFDDPLYELTIKLEAQVARLEAEHDAAIRELEFQRQRANELEAITDLALGKEEVAIEHVRVLREALAPLAHAFHGWDYVVEQGKDLGRYNFDTGITAKEVIGAVETLAATAPDAPEKPEPKLRTWRIDFEGQCPDCGEDRAVVRHERCGDTRSAPAKLTNTSNTVGYVSGDPSQWPAPGSLWTTPADPMMPLPEAGIDPASAVLELAGNAVRAFGDYLKYDFDPVAYNCLARDMGRLKEAVEMSESTPVECTCENKPWNPLQPFAHLNTCPIAGGECRGCGKPLLRANRAMADGCPCNSPRGVNHGLVPENTCTCIECDPSQSGSSHKAYVAEGPDDFEVSPELVQRTLDRSDQIHAILEAARSARRLLRSYERTLPNLPNDLRRSLDELVAAVEGEKP